MRRLGRFAVACALASSASPVRASGVDPSVREAVHLRVRPGPCGHAGELEQRLRAEGAVSAAEGETARTFELTIERVASALHGTLVVREPGGATASREVRGGSCVEVIGALAFFASLALASRTQQVAAPPPPPPPPSPPPPPPKVTRVAAPPAPRVGAHVSRWRLAIVPALDVSQGVGGAFYADVSREGASGPTPAFRAGALYVDAGPAPDLARMAARADVCPLRIDRLDLFAHLCARAELGSLRAASAVREVRLLWWGVGALAGMRWNLGPRVFLQADVGLLVIPEAPRFVLEGGAVREVPFVTPTAGIAFGVYLASFGDRAINRLASRH
jgi:hypothetical protein